MKFLNDCIIIFYKTSTHYEQPAAARRRRGTGTEPGP